MTLKIRDMFSIWLTKDARIFWSKVTDVTYENDEEIYVYYESGSAWHNVCIKLSIHEILYWRKTNIFYCLYGRKWKIIMIKSMLAISRNEYLEKILNYYY